MRVITGRPATEINQLLQLSAPVEVWGLHGAERLFIDGRRDMQQIAPEALRKLDDLRVLLRADAFGGLFEDKPNAVVMHWRGHSLQRAKSIEQKTRALFEPAAQVKGLALLPFESGIELRAGRDKGGAVRAIVDQTSPRNPVVFLGDDLTDEPGFRAINRTAAPHLSILVRRALRETDAQVWLKPPEDLRWFLRQWINALHGRSFEHLRPSASAEQNAESRTSASAADSHVSDVRDQL